jgi:hypothetical protein
MTDGSCDAGGMRGVTWPGLLLLMAACGGSEPAPTSDAAASSGPDAAPAPVDAGFRSDLMFFVGDSYLVGASTYLPDAFAGFRQEVRAKVGDTIVRRAEFLAEAAASEARGVIVQLGINDIAGGANHTVLQERIGATMDQLAAVDCLGWPTYPTQIAGSYANVAPLAPILNTMIRDEALARPWVTVIEFGPAVDADVPTLRGGDGLHPTQAGYRLLAQMYADVLIDGCHPRGQ